MKLKEKKRMMLAFIDFYGHDIPCTDRIMAAKNDDDLNSILNEHAKLMEDTLADAFAHLDRFRKEIKLFQ